MIHPSSVPSLLLSGPGTGQQKETLYDFVYRFLQSSTQFCLSLWAGVLWLRAQSQNSVLNFVFISPNTRYPKRYFCPEKSRMTMARTLGEGQGHAFILVDMTSNIFKIKDFSLWRPKYSIYLSFWREKETPKAREGKLLCNQAIPLQVTASLQWMRYWVSWTGWFQSFYYKAGFSIMF